jgi:hypothetical protein
MHGATFLLGSRDITIVQFHDCEGLQEWTDQGYQLE